MSDVFDRCPACGAESEKVIYLGLPMRLCTDDEKCCTVWGFWSWVLDFYFDGWFFSYEGSYWRALWDWLKGDVDGED